MNQSRNLWPLGIIMTFVVFISGTVALVVMASSQRVDLVSPNYYEQEIKYQSRIDSEVRAHQLGASASIAYTPAARQILITLPEEQTRRGVSGEIDLYRPSEAGLDRHFALEMKSGHTQSIDAAALQAGLWKVRVTWTANREEFSLDRSIVIVSMKKIAAASELH